MRFITEAKLSHRKHLLLTLRYRTENICWLMLRYRTEAICYWRYAIAKKTFVAEATLSQRKRLLLTLCYSTENIYCVSFSRSSKLHRDVR